MQVSVEKKMLVSDTYSLNIKVAEEKNQSIIKEFLALYIILAQLRFFSFSTMSVLQKSPNTS